MRRLSILATVTLALGCSALAGCHKQAAEPADPIPADSAVTEAGENGTVSWDVESDGKIRGTLKDKDGHPVTKDIIGTMIWPGEVADEERDIALDENGALVASGPPLADDLTEIDYALTVDGSPWNGTLHVPRGGTKAIDDDAKVAAQLTVPAGKLGPNGGTIQYIGGTPVEMVADSTSREMRLYVLDSNYNVIDPGERTFRLGYAADYSGMQVLVREPGANYYVGPWYAGYNPYRVTVAMGYGGEVHVGIVGWRWGESLRWGVYAPIGFVGVRGWAPSLAIGFGVGVGFGWGGGYFRPGGRGFERARLVSRAVPGGHGRPEGGRGGEPAGGHARGGEPAGGHARGGEPAGGHAAGRPNEPAGGHGSEPGGGHGSEPAGGRGNEPSAGRGSAASPGGHGSPSAGGRGSSPGSAGRSAPTRSAPRPSGGRRR
jgi:hypothetical protein